MENALLVFSVSAALLVARQADAEETSRPIVDIRFDGPYGQVLPSRGDEWAPTWGRNDVLYTGNDDGDSFGGLPSNTMAFGRLEGTDPRKLKGTTVNGMAEFKERNLGPELASWKSVDSYPLGGVFYRFATCGAAAAEQACLESSSDGKRWTRSTPVLENVRPEHVRFIVWSKQMEAGLGAKPSEYLYASIHAGVIEGEDQYWIGRAPIAQLPHLKTADWSFQQSNYSWGPRETAVSMSGHSKLGPDRANWKTTNSYSVDGVLYMFVMRCTYPSQSPDAKRRHVWQNSSIIKSTDGGRTWSRSPKENYTRPMFPGRRFGTAYFVWYGKDSAASVDNADRYIYAVSNNGLFENGDDYVIGRVPRSKLQDLSGADWSFYTQGDGLQEGSWSSNFNDAEPILRNPGRSGMTGMTYIPHLRRYVMVTWHYNQMNFEAAIQAKDLSTVIEFFEAPKPWGRWTKVKSLETGALGWYVPVIGQRFQEASSLGQATAFLYPTGFTAKPEGGLDFQLYKFNYVPVTLSTSPLVHKDPAYVGAR